MDAHLSAYKYRKADCACLATVQVLLGPASGLLDAASPMFFPGYRDLLMVCDLIFGKDPFPMNVSAFFWHRYNTCIS